MKGETRLVAAWVVVRTPQGKFVVMSRELARRNPVVSFVSSHRSYQAAVAARDDRVDSEPFE